MNHISDNLQLIIFHYLNSKPFLGELRDVTRWFNISSIKHPLDEWGFKPFYKSTSLEMSGSNLKSRKIVWSIIYGTCKEDLFNL